MMIFLIVYAILATIAAGFFWADREIFKAKLYLEKLYRERDFAELCRSGHINQMEAKAHLLKKYGTDDYGDR